tara:strand:- start:3984 stop:4184 length:201 start_codon:yes stop_codon:yes gene_type:complete
MQRFTEIPEAAGLFWYFEEVAAEARPVTMLTGKWSGFFKSFDGSTQNWLRDGEYLLGPQPAPQRII